MIKGERFLSSQKTKSGGQSDLRFSVYRHSDSQFLELESESDLNLPLAEERAVGCGDSAEGGVE